MAPRALQPAALLGGPFTLAEGLEAGLTKNSLRSGVWRRIARGLYVSTLVPDRPDAILPGCLRLLPANAVFSGRTAEACHGYEVPYRDPIEVTAPLHCGASRSHYFTLSRANLGEEDLTVASGVPVTTLARTLADRASQLSLTELVVRVDAALHDGRLAVEDLERTVRARAGRRGVERLRRAAELADARSESPMESRLRVELVLAGLPRPEAQVELRGADGDFLGRVDLYCADAKLAIEYDGENHRDRLAADNSRQNRILAAGYRLLRFSAADMRGDRSGVVEQVRAALRRRG